MALALLEEVTIIPTIEQTTQSRQPTNWRTIIPRKFSHSYKSSRTHNSFPNLGIWQSEVAQSCLTLWTPWTVAYQAPQCMEFSRKEYWSRLPFPSPGDLPNPGIEPRSPALQADAVPSEPPGKPGDLAKGLRTPKEFDLGGQWDLIAELACDWGKSVLEAQSLVHTRSQEKGGVTHKRLSQMACYGVVGMEYNSAGTSPFEGNAINPTIVWPWAKQQGGNTVPSINRKVD